MDPSLSIRKPLRARKTMTPSSRKQVEMLSRLKHAQEPGRTAKGDSPGRFAVGETNGLPRSSPEELGAPLPPPPTVSQPVIESGVGPQEAATELPKSPSDANADMKRFLSAGALRDLLYQWYEKDSGPPLPKPVEVHLDLVPASCLLDRSKEPRSPLAPAVSRGKEWDRKDPPLGDPTRVGSERENHGSCLQPEAAGSSVRPDEVRRKRRTSSDSREGVPPKHRKTSGGAGQDCAAGPESRQDRLGTIKSFIQERLDVAARDLDQKLQLLNQRIDRTQCLRKHEGITIRIVKRISRLARRVDAVAAVQTAARSRKGGDSANKVPTGSRSLPGIANQLPLPKPTSAGSKASPPAAESSEDIICLDAETQRPGVPTAPAPDVRQDVASVVACATAQTQDSRKAFLSSCKHAGIGIIPTSLQSKLVIDLTEEGSNASPEELETASGRAKLAPESPKSDPPQPALLSPKEVPGRFPHLPPLPRIRLLPELVKDFQGTLPPQKLELVVVRLLNPKGIGLRWNVSKVDARCAPLESFHLFLFVDSASAGTPFSWSRTNVIQALPLPMVISLSQLPASGVYYFTMQSKDVYGRYGPFCDVRSISVP